MRRPENPLDEALLVSWVTVVWSTGTGAAAALVGWRNASLSLAGLGVTVLIDVGSSLVLIWRFRHERDGGKSVEHAERVAHLVASVALVVFGALLAVQSVRSLAGGDGPDASTIGLAIAGSSIVVLPWLSRWKYRVATAVNSAALRADAHITAVGGGVAAIALVGLLVVRLWGWWWADASAALVLSAVAARQGVRSLHRQ